MALLIPLVKFKTKKKRNILVSSSVILNLLLIFLILYIDGPMKVHLFKLNNFIDIFFKIDKMGILFSILASTLWIFTTFYSMEYMEHEGNEKRFFAFFILTLGITVSIAYAGNLFTLYIFYELLTLATFPLVIHKGSKEALYSGKKYLIYSLGGATLVLFGMILLFSINNDLSFVAKGIISPVASENGRLLMIYLALFIGFGVKAAIIPFHSWLPAAMVAPTPVSSLLHAVAVVKSGIFALIRVSYFIFGVDIIERINGNLYVSVLVVITILLGSLLALHQENLKKRLAYSTVSQLGYILLGLVMLNENAFTGGILHLINHAVIKITLFFCAGAIYIKTGKKNISDIKGIGRKMPTTMVCFGIASISLIGIPPTNGFVSKWYLALGGLGANKILFPIILLVSALLTAGYLIPIIVTAFFPGEEEEEKPKRDEAPLKMLVPIVILTSIVVILGLFPNPILHFIEGIATKLI